MTKNEYIASIMLEAADLLREENGSETKKFYLLEIMYEGDDDESILSFILDNRGYDGTIEHCYSSIKDCILDSLKTCGTIKNNLYEIEDHPAFLDRPNTLYEITTNGKKERYNSKHGDYEVKLKNIIDAKKIKTYYNIEEMLKDINLKLSFKKLKDKIKSCCNDRKKMYDTIQKYLNQLENKIESNIVFNPKKEQYKAFFYPPTDINNWKTLMKNAYIEIANIEFSKNSENESKINDFKIIQKFIDMINKKIGDGYSLSIEVPSNDEYYYDDYYSIHEYLLMLRGDMNKFVENVNHIVISLTDLKHRITYMDY